MVNIIWKADIYIQKNSRWFSKHKLKKIGATPHANGCWTIEDEEKDYVTKICEKYRLKYTWYKKEWSRSGNYRDVFFQFYDPPYRCRYCHKRLPEHKVEVDHLVPVAKAKKRRYARFLLRIQGIQNVNDRRNLVASCHKCNKRKRDNMGLWYIRGRLGKYRVYWLIRDILLLVLLMGACYVGIRLYLRQR